MQTCLIIGASRGIGRELAMQLADDPDHEVIATVRQESDAEHLLGAGLRVEVCDVESPRSICRLAETLRGLPLDVVINNAGVYPDKGMNLFTLEPEAFMSACRVNALGPLLITRAMVPHLEASRRRLVINVSTVMASLVRTAADGEGSYAYRASKAALNMVTLLMAKELRPRGIACVAAHPGWVKTDMGGERAPLAVQESARRLIKAWKPLDLSASGTYIDLDGGPLPW